MVDNAIRTIRAHRWKWSRTQAMKYAQRYLNMIQDRYPTGVDNPTTYFVLPTFEHVTRAQPIIKYNPTVGNWELATLDLFTQQKIK